jgi:hypothetical protein
MGMLPARCQRDIRALLRSGDDDNMFAEGWPGNDFFERHAARKAAMGAALLAAVEQGEHGLSAPSIPDGHDGLAFARRKLEPMVKGLFPGSERAAVLTTLEKSVVFLTGTAVRGVIAASGFWHSKWNVANIYLGSLGAPLLSREAEDLAGLSESTTCYVSLSYFAHQRPFADYVIHEAAHIFHNCKRERLGLRSTRCREWLLDIAFAKRELFAYACETYGRILERARTPADRRSLASRFAVEGPTTPDESVEHAQVVDLVARACCARNGWKVILAACAPMKPPRAADEHSAA